MAGPLRDPYSWAEMFARDMSGMRDNALNYQDNALLSLFREEAARQQPYAVMPARLAEANFDRTNAVPFDIASEQRQLDNWMKQRRYQQQLDIEEAQAIGATGGGGLRFGPNGEIILNGKPVQLRPTPTTSLGNDQE